MSKYMNVLIKTNGEIFDLDNKKIGTLNHYESISPMVLDYFAYVDNNANAKDSIGELSDKYHSYNELYDHRMALFACLVSANGRAWKSKKHHDGTMYDNYFIVGINTDYGQTSYHYPLTEWDKFQCRELDLAPEFDGHTPKDTIERLLKTYLL